VRIGFVALPVGAHPAVSCAQLVALAQFGEQRGFDVAYMPDQTFHRDPYATLAVVACSTSRITLAVGATNPLTRHPAMTARVAATLSEISGGRFLLILSAGNQRDLLEPLGLPTGDAATRCREAALTIKRLLSGQTVTYESPTLVMRRVALQMPALLPVPVYLGARGPRVLEAAGEVADGAIIGGLVSDAGLDFAIGHVRRGAEAAGRRFNELEIVNWVTTIVTERKRDFTDAVRPTIAYIVGGAPFEVLDAVRIPRSLILQIKSAYVEGGLQSAAPLVDAGLIDKFTIIGDPGEVAERIARLGDHGVGQIAILMPAYTGMNTGAPFDVQQNLTRFAEDVMPRLVDM